MFSAFFNYGFRLCYTIRGRQITFKCQSHLNKSMITCKPVNSSTNFLCKIRFPCYSAPCGNAYLCCVIYCIPRRFWTQSRRVSLSVFEAQQCCMWLVVVCWTHSGSQHDGSVLLKDPLLLLLIPRQPKLVNLKPSLWRTHVMPVNVTFLKKLTYHTANEFQARTLLTWNCVHRQLNK